MLCVEHCALRVCVCLPAAAEACAAFVQVEHSVPHQAHVHYAYNGNYAVEVNQQVRVFI